MSVTYCLLVFLLLGLALHACNASRPLPASTDNKKFHISNQIDAKTASVNAEKVESSSSNKPEVAKEDSTVETHQLGNSNQKLIKDSKAKKKIMEEESTGAFQNESLVSVPWRVPHNKSGEKHPGFNFDYSPPKTHPPSHN